MVEAFKTWLGLECIGFNGYDLVRTEGATCDDVEQLLIARFTQGPDLWYFRHDIPQEIRQKFLPYHGTVFSSPGSILNHLPNTVEIRQETSYYFDSVEPVGKAVFLGDTPDHFDCFVITDDTDGVVSMAWSVRRNDHAAEIAVETCEAHRRKGYGKAVASAWVAYQMSLNKSAIYSHRSGNFGSRALAKSIGAIKFTEVLSYHD